MSKFRIRERIGIIREHLYSQVPIRKSLDQIDDKLLLMMNHMLDIQKIQPATGKLRLWQEAEFQVLRLLHAIAQHNHINFWLDFGTLVGAIRHEGFIPWDDDIDIALLHDDYDAFKKCLAKELPGRFTLSDWYGLNGDGIGIMRVTDNPSGCFVDIIPYDKIPGALNVNGDMTKWETEYLKEFADCKNYACTNGYTATLRERIANWRNSHPSGDGNKTGIALSMLLTCCIPSSRNVFQEQDIFPLRKTTFEGSEFFIPNHAEKNLNRIYGDYMKFPKDAGYSNHSYSCNPLAGQVQMRKIIDELSEIYRAYQLGKSGSSRNL